MVIWFLLKFSIFCVLLRWIKVVVLFIGLFILIIFVRFKFVCFGVSKVLFCWFICGINKVIGLLILRFNWLIICCFKSIFFCCNWLIKCFFVNWFNVDIWFLNFGLMLCILIVFNLFLNCVMLLILIKGVVFVILVCECNKVIFDC